MGYTTTDFIADVQRSGMLPSSAPLGLAAADILAHGTKELRTFIYPEIMKVREEYYVNEYRLSLTSPFGATTPITRASLKIPSRALGNKIRDVYFLRGGIMTNLTRVESERLPNIKFNITNTGEPWGFIVSGGRLELVPASTNTTSTFVLNCVTRPGKLVTAGTPCFQATTITATGTAGKFTFDFGTAHAFVLNQKVDLIRQDSPYEYRLVAATVAAVATNSVEITVSNMYDFDGTTPANEVGIWVTPEDQSPVVQCPDELYHTCVQATVARCLQASGFMEEAQAAREDAMRMLQDALILISPRVEGEPKKIVGEMAWRGRLGPTGFGW